MEEQFGDERVVPFSFTNKEEDIKRDQISCWLTYTNEETHEIIRKILTVHHYILVQLKEQDLDIVHLSKIRSFDFADKKRHQVFIEPEGELYK